MVSRPMMSSSRRDEKQRSSPLPRRLFLSRFRSHPHHAAHHPGRLGLIRTRLSLVATVPAQTMSILSSRSC